MCIDPDENRDRIWHAAQTNWVARFCSEKGLDPETATTDDLAPILRLDGEVQPEGQDVRKAITDGGFPELERPTGQGYTTHYDARKPPSTRRSGLPGT